MGRVSELFSVLLVGVLLAACAPLMDGAARTEVRVTVVYADLDTINQVARERGYRGQAYGFYDRMRNELWCPNGETGAAFRTCGHELRHVVKGPFHN
jgi:hypothetical protein